MRNKIFYFLIFLNILIIPFSVLASEEIGTSTEPVGTSTEPVGTSTEPVGTSTEITFDELFLNEAENGFSILGGSGTIFEDDFNSYNDGDLNGQGGWVGNVLYDIQGNVVKEGAKAVQCDITKGVAAYIIKSGSAISAGKIVVYIRMNNLFYNYFEFCPEYSGGRITGISIHQNFVRYSLTASPWWAIFSTNFTANKWHLIQIEWAADNTARFKFDDEEWTDWKARVNQIPDRINIAFYGFDGDFSGYFDYIAENPYTPPVPAEFNSTSTFFAFFFSFGDYLPVIFAFVLVFVLVVSFLNFILGIDR